MPLNRDQRRAMTRSVARMKSRHAAVASVNLPPEPRPEVAEMLATPARKVVEHVASRMWWAAQAPAIADDQRERLLAARATVLSESALA